MFMMNVPLFRPYVGKEELRELAKVFRSAWIGTGPRTRDFEKKFAAFIGRKEAVGVTSCTAALHLALQALDIHSGEVIIPPITHAATAHAVLFNGARPVFADVEEDTLCIDPKEIEKKITKQTRAIIPVHLGGHACDMDAIMKIAKKHTLRVIEDCANATGASYKGRMLGSFGDIGCFSFETKKNMTTGDGGMLVTDDKKVAERLRRIRWFGATQDTWNRFAGKKTYSWNYDITELGWKYNMNDIQAAIGLVQFKKLPWMLAQKDRIRKMYQKALSDLPWLVLPHDRPYTKSGWWLYIVRVPDRARFMAYLAEHGIITGVHFEPIYHLTYLKKLGIRQRMPVAEKVWKHFLSLPLYPTMTQKEFAYVAKTIRAFDPRQ